MPAAPARPKLSRAQLDKIAQMRGYRDYGHMIYVARNGLPRPKQDNGTFQSGAGTGGGGFVNFLQSLFSHPADTMRDAFAWHPANTIQRASDVLANANDQMNGQ